MKHIPHSSAALALTMSTVLLAGCAGGGGDGGGGRGGTDFVDGATFTLGIASDPGNLDPLMGANTSLFTVTPFAYDSLVSVDGETGEIGSQLAASWKVDGSSVELTLAEGITCSDGTELSASDVADSVNFVTDATNQSPLLGTFIPVGTTAEADDESRVVTLKLKEPSPFVLNGLATLPIVCPAGAKDRKSLASTTSGTGPYELTEAAPGDHYTYALREGYTWGPDGASTDERGLPATVVVRVVENETTAANLLLSGGLNAATVVGPDAERLDKSGLFHAETTVIVGEQWYNHASGRATSDPAVRMALTQALDLGELAAVITSGNGGPATTLAVTAPVACPGDSISGSLPAHDVDAAAELLDAAGWTEGPDGVREKDGTPLALSLLYPNALGSSGDAAAELVVQQWKSIGVDATAKAQNETTLTGTIFGAGDWDVAWVTLNVSSPDQAVPFLSGPAAPDGTNFSSIADEEYDDLVKDAMSLSGTDSCDTWLKAESALVAKAHVVPFANGIVRTVGKGAEFETPGQLVPLSIRMLAP